MTEQENLLSQVVCNDTLWVQLDDHGRILNWGSSELFEADGYIPIEMPQDEFFFKTLGDFVEYGHKYYKVIDGKAVLNTEEFVEIPDGSGIVESNPDGSLYFNTRRFMARKDEIVHEIFYENFEFYYIKDGELLFDQERYDTFTESQRIIELRDYRNYTLLPAFDKWERAVLVERINTSQEVYDWYYAILDLDIQAINNIPEPILYYLKDCTLSTF